MQHRAVLLTSSYRVISDVQCMYSPSFKPCLTPEWHYLGIVDSLEWRPPLLIRFWYRDVSSPKWRLTFETMNDVEYYDSLDQVFEFWKLARVPPLVPSRMDRMTLDPQNWFVGTRNLWGYLTKATLVPGTRISVCATCVSEWWEFALSHPGPYDTKPPQDSSNLRTTAINRTRFNRMEVSSTVKRCKMSVRLLSS
ncbi:hypothetical protein PM082_015637 [Marasmius tenuissimus]|nr:hypothetical protein PM082_015637 [Marasmius tenuissimus]